MEEEPIRVAVAKRERDDDYWVPALGVDYEEDLDNVMGTEFSGEKEAVLAFKEYARMRMFEPMKRSDTCLGCKWKSCAFSVQFDGPELREVILEKSNFVHVHTEDPVPVLLAPSSLPSARKKKRSSNSSRKASIRIASYASFSLRCRDSEDPWKMRAKWLDVVGDADYAFKLPGLGGNAGPVYAGSQKYHVPDDIPEFPWSVAKKHVATLKRYRRAHFDENERNSYRMSTVVIRTEALTLDEMAMDISDGDASYLRWWVVSTPGIDVRFLRVVGASAFALERTFMLLQYVHGTFDRFGSGAPFVHTAEYREGNLNAKRHYGQMDGASRHAIFVPLDRSKIDTECLLAIDSCALAVIRMESMVYIPLQMRMPAAPVLLQAWSRSSEDPMEPELRLHGMAATMHFFAQHLTRVHTMNNRWIHPVASPAFAIYDMFPEFLEMLRCHKDTHMLSMIRESMLDGAHAENRDSYLQCILGFVLQRQEHTITRRMNDMLLGMFDRSHDLRHVHPIAAALLRHYRENPTPIRRNLATQRLDFYLSSWNDLKLDSVYEKYRPKMSVSECKPHHFLYMLCFDKQNFDERMRADIALSFGIDNYDSRTGRNDLHLPSFNMSKHIETADQLYVREFRNYMKTCANPLGGRGSEDGGPPSTKFFSDDLRDALPLRALYLTMATIQHLSWNPPRAYSPTEDNPNRIHGKIAPLTKNPRLNSDNVISVVRVANVASVVTGRVAYDMPVARTSHFVPSAEVPAMRPFPRRPAIYHDSKKVARVETFSEFKPTEEVLYMSEFLVAFPLLAQPSKAGPTIAQLDAFLLVRDPAYFRLSRQ